MAAYVAEEAEVEIGGGGGLLGFCAKRGSPRGVATHANQEVTVPAKSPRLALIARLHHSYSFHRLPG